MVSVHAHTSMMSFWRTGSLVLGSRWFRSSKSSIPSESSFSRCNGVQLQSFLHVYINKTRCMSGYLLMLHNINIPLLIYSQFTIKIHISITITSGSVQLYASNETKTRESATSLCRSCIAVWIINHCTLFYFSICWTVNFKARQLMHAANKHRDKWKITIGRECSWTRMHCMM